MRKVQPVSFSLSDPFESELYKYAINNGAAFSKYVKRLIQRDMERTVRVVSTKKAPAQPNVIHGGTNAFTNFRL